MLIWPIIYLASPLKHPTKAHIYFLSVFARRLTCLVPHLPLVVVGRVVCKLNIYIS